MTETELEFFLQAATSISLQPGRYSLISPELPGEIIIKIKYEKAEEYLQFYHYINNNFKDIKITAKITQRSIDKIDLILLIESDPPRILKVSGLNCKNDNIDFFFKKQPQNKPLNLFIRINKPITSLEEMGSFMEAEDEAGVNKPLIISSWKGVALNTDIN